MAKGDVLTEDESTLTIPVLLLNMIVRTVNIERVLHAAYLAH